MPGVYISFPFCAQKCTFCNFASGVFPRELEDEYLSALRHELGAHNWHWRPETVYIGGGTPSRLTTAKLQQILNAVPGRPWREATLEAAPGSLTRERVAGWVQAGIDRVSLGVQSFVQRELARTGRKHDAAVVAADVELLRKSGIKNINIDLIAGLPGQTCESWAESLAWIERLRPPHVSVYLFEIDEDSRLGLEVIQGGSRYDAGAVPDDGLAAELYETAVHRLHDIGIERYEISNFAVPGAESLHNLKYWTREPYAGFGADAHSFDGRRRTANAESAADYVKRWRERRGFALEATEANAEEERFFVGLRLLRGIELEPSDYARFGSTLDRLIADGLLAREGPRIRLTDRGVRLSNEVFAEFID